MTTRYRGYTIYYDPPPIPIRDYDWHYEHDDYDGAEDAHDPRGGSTASVEDCKREIDNLEELDPDPWTCQVCGDPLADEATGDPLCPAHAGESNDPRAER